MIALVILALFFAFVAFMCIHSLATSGGGGTVYPVLLCVMALAAYGLTCGFLYGHVMAWIGG